MAMKVSKISAVGGSGTPSVDTSSHASYDTKPIIHIQGGVKDGKTGKNSFYVYSKNPTDKDFDVNKHRETVYQENMSDLRRTHQYRTYAESMKKK
jgi:hypothetical protein